MRVLFDLNVVLDVLLAREPWVAEARALWDHVATARLEGALLSSSITDLHYIAQKLAGGEKARSAVEAVLSSFIILPVDRADLEAALTATGRDFEDNLALSVAARWRLDAIVTRDRAGFTHSTVPVHSPRELLAILAEDASGG